MKSIQKYFIKAALIFLIIISSDSSGNYALNDKKGNYKIDGLKPSSYYIVASALNYETVNKSNIVGNKNDVSGNIDFLLNTIKVK